MDIYPRVSQASVGDSVSTISTVASFTVGTSENGIVGASVRTKAPPADGASDGSKDGLSEGDMEGIGDTVGCDDGILEGVAEGMAVSVGDIDGEFDKLKSGRLSLNAALFAKGGVFRSGRDCNSLGS
eukprot:scaffold1775_cov83-Cylindrotheca_fusiformis.AAC.9